MRHAATKFEKVKPGEETPREALYKDELKEVFEDYYNNPLDEVPVEKSPVDTLHKNNLTQMPDNLDPIATKWFLSLFVHVSVLLTFCIFVVSAVHSATKF